LSRRLLNHYYIRCTEPKTVRKEMIRKKPKFEAVLKKVGVRAMPNLNEYLCQVHLNPSTPVSKEILHHAN